MQTVQTQPATQPAKLNTPRIRVLHIIKSLGRGGAETLLPETLAAHDQTVFEFHYIYFLPWKDQMVGQIKKGGGTISCFEARNNFQIFRKVPKIAAYIKEHGIDLIHCHLPWAGIAGRLAGQKTGVPVVYTEHNKWERYHKLTYYINKLSFSKQHTVIAVSDDVAQSIKKFYPKQKPVVRVVLNGTNTEKFKRSWQSNLNVRKELSISEDALVIGIVCVFRVQKRLLTWLEIAQQLLTHQMDLHFIVAGDGPLKDEVHQKAAALGLTDKVHFVGLQEEIRPYLQAMDIFMMSSEFEGLPIALLEAMSMECMPACTAAGGIPELITHGENGLLVPVSEPKNLVDALLPYLADSSKRIAAAQKARQTVQNHFSMKQMVAQIEKIYLDILNNKR